MNTQTFSYFYTIGASACGDLIEFKNLEAEANKATMAVDMISLLIFTG